MEVHVLFVQPQHLPTLPPIPDPPHPPPPAPVSLACSPYARAVAHTWRRGITGDIEERKAEGRDTFVALPLLLTLNSSFPSRFLYLFLSLPLSPSRSLALSFPFPVPTLSRASWPTPIAHSNAWLASIRN